MTSRRIIFVDPELWGGKNIGPPGASIGRRRDLPTKNERAIRMSEQMMQSPPAEDVGRAAALLCHVATGDQAGYNIVGAEAITAGRLHGLLGGVMFLVNTMFFEQLQDLELIESLRELTIKCQEEQ